MSYASTVLADSPSGYWHLDENVGASVFADSSGNGWDATISGTPPTLGVAPLISVGKAASFGGSPQAAQTGRQIFFGFGAISAEAWISTTMDGSTNPFFLSSDDPNFTRYFQFRLDPGGVINVSLFSGNGGTAFIFSKAVNDGKKHHVLFSYDNTTCHLYIDGVEDGTGITNAGKFETGAAGTGAISIAKRFAFGSDSQFFTGTIDEPAIYKTALSGSSALAHYNAGISTVQAQPQVLTPYSVSGGLRF